MILKKSWLNLILKGEKTMELRGQRARLGWTWLGEGNSVQGRARIVACQQLTLDTYSMYRPQHRVTKVELHYKKTNGLWLEDVQLPKKPIFFWKPWGVIGWAVVRYSSRDLPSKSRSKGQRKRSSLRRPKLQTQTCAGRRTGHVGDGGLMNIGNACFLNSVLQAILHVPHVANLLRPARRACGSDTWLWCLLRRTTAVREPGRADAEHMRLWLPALARHDLDATGAQDSAFPLAAALCETLREQQAGGAWGGCPGVHALVPLLVRAADGCVPPKSGKSCVQCFFGYLKLLEAF